MTWSGRNTFKPRPGEPPIVIFGLQVLGRSNLLAKDRGGHRSVSSFILLSLFQLSQIPPRFVAVSVLDSRQQTSVVKLTTNPTYAAKDATFDFPIYLSLADKLGVVELVVWDKDMLSKEYLGEVALPLDDLFVDRQTGNQKVIWF